MTDETYGRELLFGWRFVLCEATCSPILLSGWWLLNRLAFAIPRTRHLALPRQGGLLFGFKRWGNFAVTIARILTNPSLLFAGRSVERRQ